ncbi:MAG: hypothetical protein JKY03_12720 [Aureispira sp.]|nr:hypothetical protein [Aureispira sp.]
MKFLKQGLVVLMFALFITACTQDSDCTPPAVEQNIVGTWTVTGGVAAIEFQANGTLIDSSDDFIAAIFNNDTLNVKTYSISNDTLYTSAASSTSPNVINGSYAITNNECDKITVSTAGIPIVFTRQ